MARDRQRAKQRRARRAGENPGPRSSRPLRENVPGELDHASGEVDEFEAALVAGADGEPAADEPAADMPAGTEDAGTEEEQDLAGPHPEELSEDDFEELEDEVDEAADDAAEGRRPRAGRAARRERAAPREHAAEHRPGVLARFVAFLKASWAELQRVQWPDRRQVSQATAVVLG
ncbi:MAG TPA: preprotein translocase subunit SecE, partial [Solirubrobacteraceae bacterium]|nr:preprotein translocase subunit SecE [Solirubrobacteraceae bacterium]